MSTATTTTETPTIPPIEEVAEVSVTDGSRIADRKQYLSAFGDLRDALVSHVAAMLQAGEASRLGALASLAIRESILRGDNGAPDFAGNTSQYALAWNTYLDRFATESKIGKPDVDRFRNNVRRYMSDTQMLQARMAEYVTANDSQVTTKTADVRSAIEKREKVPADVKKGLSKLLATQVSKNGKTRLNGMERPISTFGPAAKRAGGAAGAGNTGKLTPSKAWQALRDEMSKLAPATATEELHHLATALSDHLIGPAGTKLPKVPDRPKVVENLQATVRLLQGTLAVIEPDGKGTKDAVQEHRWSERD